MILLSLCLARYSFFLPFFSFLFSFSFFFPPCADWLSRPPRWPSGSGVLLESGRCRVRIPFAPGIFPGSSHTSDLKIGTPVVTCQCKSGLLNKSSGNRAVRLCSKLRIGLTVVVCWLLNVPATCKCISGTDLLRQFYVLPH